MPNCTRLDNYGNFGFWKLELCHMWKASVQYSSKTTVCVIELRTCQSIIWNTWARVYVCIWIGIVICLCIYLDIILILAFLCKIFQPHGISVFCFVFFYFAMEQPGCLLRVLQTSHCCACLTYLTRSVKDLAITFAQYANFKFKSQFKKF